MNVELAAAVLPYVSAAVGRYGTAVVTKVSTMDPAPDATVGVGHRLLRRVLDRAEHAPAVRAAVADLAEDPTDDDRVAALRVQFREALAADPGLAQDVADILAGAGVAIIGSGERAVAVYTVSEVGTAGDRSGEWPIIRPR
jgi:hypothetical protein